MSVFDDKRVSAHLGCCGAMKILSITDNGVVDLFNRGWFEHAQGIADSPCCKTRRFIPITNAQKTSQGSMVLAKILELVVIEIATQSNDRKNHDLPVVEPFSTNVIASRYVDVCSDEFNQMVSQLELTEDMFQRFTELVQSRHDS